MAFLPTGYETPQADSNYMKLEEGDNAFRVLSSAIIGWEWWEEKEGKRHPRRVRNQSDITKDELDYIEAQYELEGREQLKHFWAFVVWNYDQKKVQILEISQLSVMRGMQKYIQNEKWGDPKEYDFIVSREGEKLLTKYTVTVNPKEAIDKNITNMYINAKINLNALYEGKDPWKSEGKEEVDADEIEKMMK